MRRGIATFRFLFVVAAFLGGAICASAPFIYLARTQADEQRVRVAVAADQVATVRRVTFTPDGRRVIVGGDPEQVTIWDVRTGRPLTLKGLTVAPQDLTRASLTDCRLIGDWCGRSLVGARLWECDLSGALLDKPIRSFESPYPEDIRPSVDLGGALYDRATRWPAGFDRGQVATGSVYGAG
jgi:hypothetical protein